MNGKTVVIVGAGVGGLSAAWWLGRAGWRVVVLEQADDLRADGYMIGLSGPGYAAAERMGLLDELKAFNLHIEENLYLDQQGRELLRVRYPDILGSINWFTLARTDLVTTLYHRVLNDTGAEIRFGTRMTDFIDGEGSVRLQLSDGSWLEADLLIGADGVHSATRRQLFGPDSDCLEYMGYRVAAFQSPASQPLERDFLSYAQPGQLTEFYRLSDGRMASLYLWKDGSTDRVTTRSEARSILASRYRQSHPDVLSNVAQLPAEAPMLFDALTMVSLPQWSRGRVLLLGDAAHCLTLLSGQGAGMAMTSACLLAEKLAQLPVAQALQAHEAQLRPAILRLQQRSRDIAPWFLPATTRAFRLRNLLLKWMPRRLLGWYFLRAVRADILAATGVEA